MNEHTEPFLNDRSLANPVTVAFPRLAVPARYGAGASPAASAGGLHSRKPYAIASGLNVYPKSGRCAAAIREMRRYSLLANVASSHGISMRCSAGPAAAVSMASTA